MFNDVGLMCSFNFSVQAPDTHFNISVQIMASSNMATYCCSCSTDITHDWKEYVGQHIICSQCWHSSYITWGVDKPLCKEYVSQEELKVLRMMHKQWAVGFLDRECVKCKPMEAEECILQVAKKVKANPDAMDTEEGQQDSPKRKR